MSITLASSVHYSSFPSASYPYPLASRNHKTWEKQTTTQRKKGISKESSKKGKERSTWANKRNSQPACPSTFPFLTITNTHTHTHTHFLSFSQKKRRRRKKNLALPTPKSTLPSLEPFFSRHPPRLPTPSPQSILPCFLPHHQHQHPRHFRCNQGEQAIACLFLTG